MKKWNNPELLSLGVENTFEDMSTFGSDKTHYCHKGDGGKCEIEGTHGMVIGHTTPQRNWKSVHKGEVNPHPGYEHCCCYEVQSAS